jgi:hypothetical protein
MSINNRAYFRWKGTLLILAVLVRNQGQCQELPEGKLFPGTYLVNVLKGPAFGNSGFDVDMKDSTIAFFFSDSTAQASSPSGHHTVPLTRFNDLLNFIAKPYVHEKSIDITFLSCDAIWDYENHWNNVTVSSGKIKHQIYFRDDSIWNGISFSVMSCDSIRFLRTTIHGRLSFYDANINQLLSFENCKIIGTVEFGDTVLPREMSFYNLDLTELKGAIDLTRADTANGICHIDLVNTDLSKIKFNLRNFEIAFPPHYDDNSKENFYLNLLNKFRSEGAEENVELADIQYKRFKYSRDHSAFLNFIDENWWNYGYRKSLIIRNSLLLFLFFYIINMLLYRVLVFDVYKMDNLARQYAQTKSIKNLLNRAIRLAVDGLLYTTFIFWNLRLEWKEIRTRHYWLVLYVILQYIVGLVCLSYLANLILTK